MLAAKGPVHYSGKKFRVLMLHINVFLYVKLHASTCLSTCLRLIHLYCITQDYFHLFVSVVVNGVKAFHSVLQSVGSDSAAHPQLDELHWPNRFFLV